MGSQIHITCDGCDIDLTEIIGCGFAGTEYLICACDDCKVFANRNDSGVREGKVRPKFRCGNCRKPLRVIALVDNEYGDVDGSLGTCPVCKGNLNSESTGMIWD